MALIQQKQGKDESLVSVHIRAVRDGDFDELARLYTYYALNTVYTYFDRPASGRYMRGLLTGEGHYCAVAEVDGVLAGYVHISPGLGLHRNRSEIALYLFPEHTGRGLGKQLLMHGEVWSRRHDFDLMASSVCTENLPSMHLFASNGYRYTTLRKSASHKFGRELHTQSFEKQL